jgi:anti-sigma factor RsiW
MSPHVRELLPLSAAGALDPEEQARVLAHLRECEACARELATWGRLVSHLGQLAAPRASAGLRARTRQAADLRLAERAEQAWNRAAFGFLVAFAWTLAVVSWVVMDLVGGNLALRLGRPMGPTVAWYAAYVMAGWLAAGASALFVGRSAQEEGRTA